MKTKTIKDILETPVSEYITLWEVYSEKEVFCSFCGKDLYNENTENIKECSCGEAKAAKSHNFLYRMWKLQEK